MSEFRRALEQIASGEVPCITCGQVHRYRPRMVWVNGRFEHSDTGGTWASPDDGHAYRRMAAHRLAESVLAGTA